MFPTSYAQPQLTKQLGNADIYEQKNWFLCSKFSSDWCWHRPNQYINKNIPPLVPPLPLDLTKQSQIYSGSNWERQQKKLWTCSLPTINNFLLWHLGNEDFFFLPLFSLFLLVAFLPYLFMDGFSSKTFVIDKTIFIYLLIFFFSISLPPLSHTHT